MAPSLIDTYVAPMIPKVLRKSAGASPVKVHNNTSEFDTRYQLGKKLGSGKFASVHKSFDTLTRRDVNVKVIDKRQLSDAARAALQREVSILQGVNHSSCMSVSEIYEDADRCCLVTKCLTGGDLLDRLVEDGPFEEAEAKIVAKNILEAMVYCHENKIVHRDVKPENIVFDTQGGLKCTLVDFGLAGIHDDKEPLSNICGTIEYLAPEMLQIAQGTRKGGYSYPVDMWSFGVVLYAMVSACRPFRADSTADLVAAVLNAEYDFDEEGWDVASEEAKNLVSLLLVADPRKRLTAKQALNHPWFKC
eukprot:GFYU01000698.1.p1 GENE.GFYU01000698.1~~GFYU01000698.1.p1  ORF type:complete len:305 (-),score=89.71 GFYU01000698.1:94-1008(-)